MASFPWRPLPPRAARARRHHHDTLPLSFGASSTMTTINRREFLERSKQAGLGLAAGVTILRSAQSARAYSANEKVTLASVGVRGRGSQLAQAFLDRSDCQIGYICDPD